LGARRRSFEEEKRRRPDDLGGGERLRKGKGLFFQGENTPATEKCVKRQYKDSCRERENPASVMTIPKGQGEADRGSLRF